MSEPAISVLEAIDDQRLFGSAFRDLATWRSWLVFLRVLFGLKLDDDGAALYRECTGRTMLPSKAFTESWLVCGRRSGKSFTMALIAVFLAVFRDYRGYLGPGEKAFVLVIAADRKQARQVLRYVKGLLSVPVLKQQVIGDTADSVELIGSTVIEVSTASMSVRGYSVAAALADELAFWPSEDASTPHCGVEACAGDDSGFDADLRVEPVCAAWGAVDRLPPVFRGRGRQCAGVACGYAGDEPFGAAADH
jgi:hypothetical protein